MTFSKLDSRRSFSLLIMGTLLLSVLSVALVVKPAEAAPDAPQFRNVGPADGTSVTEGETLALYAQGYSDIGLDYAWLSTDESGTWKNYTNMWTDWEASESNPIVDGDSVFGHPNENYWTEDSKVIKVDGTYYMATANGPNMGSMRIYMLSSPSLTGPWNVINDGQPIVPNGASGSWDQGQLRVAGQIVHDSGTYYLYYMGTSGGGVQSIGVAITSDAQFPTGWTKYGSNPIFTPTGTGWESSGIYTFSVARIGPPESEWYVHYSAHQSYIWSLGICYGSSPLGPFTRHGSNPILQRGLGEWDNLGLPRVAMIKIGDTIYGAYESAKTSGSPPNWDFQVGGYEGEITDGILDVTFSKNPNNPIIPGDAGSALQTANPHWYYENGTRYLFVGSCGQGTGPTWRYVDLFSSSSIHGSPIETHGAVNTWTWSNFTWSNSSITAGTTIQWRIYCKDTAGNVNRTEIHSFSVKPPEHDYVDLDTSDVDDNGSKGTHSNFDKEKACDSVCDTLSETAGEFGIMSYRKKITINHDYVDEDLDNFPVLIDIYDTDLHVDVQSSGNDIAFTDSSGRALDHEIEYFNRDYNTTHAHLVAWVRANLTSATDTTIFMIYGNPACGSQQNPTGVWDSNFVGIWHMNQADASDSTSNSNDGTQAGGVTQTSSGKVDGADSFDGINDNIRVLHDGSLNLVNDFTIELWMKPAVLTQTSRYLLGKLSGTADNTYSIIWEYTNNQAEFYSGAYTGSNPRTGSGITISDTNWHYICYAYDGSIWRGFKDNTTIFSVSRDFDLTTTTGNLFFGEVNGGTTYNLNGMLDEIRISNIGRSAAWINATYHLVQNQTDFRTIGNEEGGPSNYELDLEIQWIDVDYTHAHEELCIKTCTFSGSENIQVRIWNSADNTWNWVMNLAANQWNNVSVISYLTEPTFTVQLLGGTESGDTEQDSWSIDGSLIHTWDLYTALTVSCDPSIVNKMGSQITTISGLLSSGGSGVSDKTIKLYYQAGATGPNQPPTDGTWTEITTETITDGEGSFSYNWDPLDTLANGYYWINATFEGDAGYGPSSATTGVNTVSNLFVIPEYTVGTMLAIAVCFFGVAVYKRSKRHRLKPF